MNTYLNVRQKLYYLIDHINISNQAYRILIADTKITKKILTYFFAKWFSCSFNMSNTLTGRDWVHCHNFSIIFTDLIISNNSGGIFTILCIFVVGSFIESSISYLSLSASSESSNVSFESIRYRGN